MCKQCVSDVQIAFVYKKKCEDSDVKLRAFFQERLSIAVVEVERNDNTTQFYAEETNVKHSMEKHWSENEFSPNDDDWPMSDNESNSMNKSSNVDIFVDDELPITNSKKAMAVNLRARIPRHLEKKIKNRPVSDKPNHLGKQVRCYTDDRKKTLRRTTKIDTEEESGSSAPIDDICTEREPTLKTNNDNTVKPLGKTDRTPVERPIRDSNAVDDDEDLEIVGRAQCVDGRWLCEICNKSLADPKTLTLHVRLHLGKKLKRCSVCNKGFAKQNHLDQHMKRHVPKTYRCRDCEKVFTTKDERRQHRNDSHKIEKAVPKKIDRSTSDETDGVKIGSASELDELVDAAKSKNGEFGCFVCDRKFTEKQTLRLHLVIHNTIEMKRCELCGEGFRMVDQFNDHMAWHESTDAPEREEDAAVASYATLAEKNSVEKDAIEKSVDAEDEAVAMASRAGIVDGRFKCEICERTLVDRKSLVLHIRLHTGKNLHRCTYCQRGFSKRSHLNRHVGSHEKKLNPDQDAVTKPARNRSKLPSITLSAFELLGQPNAQKRCECKVCNTSFDKIAKLRAHIYTHDAADPLIQVTHSSDSYQITNSAGWELTLSDSETDADDSDDDDNNVSLSTTHRIHTCGRCDRTYDRRYKLIAHMTFDHSGCDFECFRCTNCNQFYPNEEILARHRRQQCDNALKKFVCKKCGVRFQWANNLEMHVSRGHQRKKLSCDNCDRKYLRYQDLERHKKTHEKVQVAEAALFKYICEVCSKPFKQHGDYKRHRTIHNADEKQFTCDICHRKFARKDNMKYVNIIIILTVLKRHPPFSSTPPSPTDEIISLCISIRQKAHANS